MKKNYFFKTAILAEFLTFKIAKKSWKNTATTWLLTLFTLLGFTDAFGQTTEAITTTGAGSWTVPCGVTNITVEAWGGGGAGGGSTTNNDSGDGGGSGAYTSRTFTVTPGTPINYTVGAGGNGSTSNGGNGGDTSILGMIAGGGRGGNANGGTVSGTGGTATGGTINTNGNNGTAGGSDTGGNGGNAPNGGNGGAGINNNNGNPGATPGGGGGGGEGTYIGWWFTNRSGGNGGDGQIRITYITSTPAVPANPTSNSPQCNPPGVTLTRVGTPPAGVTWYWQTAATGTDMSSSGTTFIATTTGTYYLRARNNTSGCWSNGAGSRAVTITSLPATVTSPTPTNGTTGVCYAGAGAVTSISWGAVAGATSYDVYFGAGSVPATVTANVATNTYNTGALAANTTYYWRIVAKNACGDAPTSATFSFTTSGSTCYCESSGGTYPNGISGVNFNTINNLNTAVNVAYRDYTYLSTSIVKTLSYNLRVFVNTGGNYTNHQSVYIDWNGDGDFVDAGEFYNLGTATNVTNGLTSLSPLSITVPAGAITGSVRMRIQSRYNSATTGPCHTGFDGEVEDYMLNILAATPCTTPTAQPTALNLTAGGSIISGSFTASVPAANSYLVIIGTSATPPAAPVNGTNYTIGSVYQAGGYTVVDIDNNTTFAATGLGASTPYYFYIYSYNNLCTGGPLYLGTSPLSGTATTTALTYCEPTTTLATEFITGIASVGTINDVSNTSGYSPGGYANYSSIIIATQIPGGSININLSLTDITTSERQFVRTWVDWNNDGDFDDTGELVYTTGNTATGTTSYGFLVPAAQALGDYRMRIKTRNYGASSSYNSCDSYSRGETEDYTIRIIADCPAKITGITPGSACGPTNTVTLSATMSAGSTQIHWYNALTGGTHVGTGPSFTTPVLSSSTTYYVTASNGSCETIHRTPIKATILSTTDITITPSVPEVCGEDNVVSISALGDNITEIIHTQDFESGLSGYTINTTGDTTPTSGTAPDAPWSIKTSPYQTTTNVWKPAINSGPVGTVGNRFAFTTSDYSATDFTTTITSPAINVSAYSSLTLTFDHFFSRYIDDLGTIEASTDNGITWLPVHSYTAKDGSASKFKSALFDLTPYTGVTELRIRFVYHGSYDDGWAIDNIKLEGVRPLNTLFTWTGATIAAFADAACTVPYTNQPVTTVYVKPTPSQLAMPSWSFTANATLGNGCIISTPVTITNKTKLWKGTSDNNWYNPNNWEPTGIPDANTCVYVYPGSTAAAHTSNLNTVANDGFAKIVTVRPSGVLTIHPNNDLTVTDAVTVDAGGTFNIESSGSLIQVNNVANSGIISMKRNASIKALDYVYWSSPVASFASSAISPLTSTGLIWKWEPTTSTAFTSNFGNWSNGNETMTLGRGYIVRAPGGWPTTPTLFTANFVGTPNNGTITRTITRSDYTGTPYTGPTSTQVTANDDNWNLLGNPYPSAISADAFINTNITHLHGFVDLWTHGAPPAAIADPFYQDYQLNYNPNDYLRYNHLGGTQFGFDGKIGAGQGFFVLMTDAGTMSEVATFNNSMRSKDHRNDQFFRTTATTTSSIDTVERHRIWMKLVAPSGLSSDMLVGYATGATNSLDATFDAMNKGVKVNFELYSLNEGEGLSIQGRALPFDSTDTIPLGVAISQNGIQTIAVTTADGLFESPTQGIYLEDLVLNVIHDLRAAPYTFTAAPGRYENRFVLRFDNTTLGNSDFITDNHITVYTNETIHVTASSAIKQVTVYDVLGRMLGMVNAVNNTEVSLKGIAKTQSPLVVLVTLENGVQTTQKIIF